MNAIKVEINNMKNLNVFQTINNIPKKPNLISCKWVFKCKRDENGNITKRKARLVAKEFSQRFSIDYSNTFSPTLKQESLRVIVALAVQRNFEIFQIDINAAYLNADLEIEIYMKLQENKGYSPENKGFWKLKKALYGLEQAGRQWNEKLNETLIKINFKSSLANPVCT